MRRQLTDQEYAAKLRDFQFTAFRLETQSAYAVPEESDLVERLRAGEEPTLDDMPGLRPWFTQIRSQVAEGKRVARVRVHDDPPTEYQKLERWADRWNLEAGEEIRYLTRQHAYDIGLLPDAGGTDWWLLDSHELLIMSFDSGHQMIRRELVTDPADVVKAAVWRDLAVHHGGPGGPRHSVV